MSYTVVIPSRNPTNATACLNSIWAAGEKCHVIIVDDGMGFRPACSVDYTLEIIRGEKPFIYARNCNMGIAAAGNDDVILLNDDALLKTPSGFATLSRAAEWNQEFGLIAATTETTGNPNQWPKGEGLRIEPRMVCFVCVYIPRRTIETIGILDQRFVGYGYEDDDFCARVRKAGLKIGIHDGCYVDHRSLKSTFRGTPNGQVSLDQNRDIFLAKWGKLNV